MRVLIVDEIHVVLEKILTDKGFSCHYCPQISAEEAISALPDYEGIVIRSKFILDKNILASAKKLLFIARLGSGLENVDVAFAESKGIVCINSPEGNRNAVGEHALGMLLTLFNNICKGNHEVKKGIWQREANRGIELSGKTVGIIGYGNTGSAFAQKLSGFDVDILAYDKYKKGFENDLVKEVTLNQIFVHANILSLHVPLTEETFFMIDDHFIQRFQKNFFLINTSRGKVVRTSDLVQNLKTGKVLGAALDVLEYENKDLENIVLNSHEDFDYLSNCENVIFTPHIAGWTHESYIKLAKVLANKIVKRFA